MGLGTQYICSIHLAETQDPAAGPNFATIPKELTNLVSTRAHSARFITLQLPFAIRIIFPGLLFSNKA